MMNKEPTLLRTTLDLIDAVVELCLKTALPSFLKLHERFYKSLNLVLRKFLDENHVPVWFTANFVTYARTALVVPTMILLTSKGYRVLVALIVLLVDFGDFLDGVVARYWKDRHHEEESSRGSKTPEDEADSFEVVTAVATRTIPSWVQSHRNKTYGGFVDAICVKAFVVPCWISLLHYIPESNYLRLLQYFVFISLILAETASACIRFRAFFTSGGVAAPEVEGMDFSTSAVKADHVGKAKQTFEMFGTAFFLIPLTKYIGLFLLCLALPLAYESVRRKIVKRVIYVSTSKNQVFDHKTIQFWLQAGALGSRLIVGVPDKRLSPMVMNALSCSAVSEVVTEAPAKPDVLFLEKLDIDYVVNSADQKTFVTDEVVSARRVLSLGDDNVARLVEPKSEKKE